MNVQNIFADLKIYLSELPNIFADLISQGGSLCRLPLGLPYLYLPLWSSLSSSLLLAYSSHSKPASHTDCQSLFFLWLRIWSCVGLREIVDHFLMPPACYLVLVLDLSSALFFCLFPSSHLPSPLLLPSST